MIAAQNRISKAQLYNEWCMIFVRAGACIIRCREEITLMKQIYGNGAGRILGLRLSLDAFPEKV